MDDDDDVSGSDGDVKNSVDSPKKKKGKEKGYDSEEERAKEEANKQAAEAAKAL